MRIEPGSRLRRLLGAPTVRVNSQHHQGIRDLKSDPWLLAVQWHPEELAERAVFRGFAEACA